MAMVGPLFKVKILSVFVYNNLMKLWC